MKNVDVVIIGGGSAGLSCALTCYEQGLKDILIIERNEELGGILQQCIHNGFGLQVFNEELSGPMYAQRFIDKIKELQIPYLLNTSVIKVNNQKELLYVNSYEGYVWVKARAIVFASGCFERNRGAIQIPGKRLPGVYTAGSAQRFLNIENILVGKKVFILGSGDIGLIMARRMSLEGAQVVGVAEIMPYSNGLTRNIVQCLKDFDIPLYLSHTVVDIQGSNHVEKIVIAQVDDERKVIQGTEKTFAIDTLLLSIGLIPDQSLYPNLMIECDEHSKGASVNENYETTVKGIYVCGNALHVHDIVDYVTMEAKECALKVVSQLRNLRNDEKEITTSYSNLISYVVPQRLHMKVVDDVTFSFRVKKPLKNCEIVIYKNNEEVKRIKKRVLLPAEMERITLCKELMQDVEELRLEVLQ